MPATNRSPKELIRRRPKQKRSQVLVEATLEATQLLLAEIGYEATNTTRIADRAGVSIGSLYQYFSNKDEIIAELQRRHHEETSAVLEVAFREAEDLEIEQAVYRLVQATVELHRHDPLLHRVLSEIVPPSVNAVSRAEMSAKINHAMLRWFQSVASRLPLPDFELSGLVIRQAVEGSIHQAVLHGDPAVVDRVADEVTAMVVAYIRRQGSPLPGRDWPAERETVNGQQT
ncbi:MAG: TetR/AcrR family transcriptional regulator [Pseudomonadota bacterium]